MTASGRKQTVIGSEIDDETQDIGDLANLIAGVGVILSLLFIGYEIRQNTAETRAAGAATVGDSFRELILARAQSPSLAAAIVAISSGEQPTPIQEVQYSGYLIALIRTVEDAYLLYRAGRLDEDQLQVRLAGLNNHINDRRGRDRWDGFKSSGIFSADFTRWLDEQLIERYGE